MSKRCRDFMLCWSVAVLATGLVGCVSQRHLARDTVDFNMAVERSQNEMLVLNAVRASLRRPMYLSGILKVTGSVNSQVTAGLSIPFGRKDQDNTATTGATYSDNPTFDVPVLDTQEFMRGFLRSVEMKTFQRYWDEGWPKSLLIHLLVQRVVVREETVVEEDRDGDGDLEQVVHVTEYPFDNYPDATDDNLCVLDKFSRVIKAFLERSPTIENRKETTDFGPPLPRSELGGLEMLMAAAKDNFTIKEVKRTGEGAVEKRATTAAEEKDEGEFDYQVRRITSELMFRAYDLPGLLTASQKMKQRLCEISQDEEGKPAPPRVVERGILKSEYLKEDPPEREGVPTESRASSEHTSKEVGKDAQGKPKSEVSVQWLLRSPEAVLYYLGQLTRVANTAKVIPQICVQGRFEPIFVALRSDLAAELKTDCFRGVVNAKYDAQWYIIPNRSLQVKDIRRCSEEAPQASMESPGVEALIAAEEQKVAQEKGIVAAPLACISGRSMQSLSLLSQLIALQKNMQELPTTTVVRTIGGQ